MRRFIYVFAVASLAALWLNNASADDWTPLWTTAQLSQARGFLSATSVGSKVFFAGGDSSYGISNVVDIYDTSTGSWSTATLSQARIYLAATSAGNQAFFAGGYNYNYSASNVVDIYNTSTGIWSTATLSVPRDVLAATSAGNEIFFGGGVSSDGISNVVDIYNTSTGTWSTANLSQARCQLAATFAGNQVFFAGGGNGYVGGYSSAVDIYNTSTGSWSTATLSEARENLAATSAGNQVFFAGGYYSSGFPYSSAVDIYNTSTGSWSTATLAAPRENLAATSAGNLVFFAGGDSGGNYSSSAVDIYKTSTGSWSTAQLSQARYGLAATSAGNQVFFAGGQYSGGYSSAVDIYTFQNYPSISSTKTFTLVDNTTVTGQMQLSGGSLGLGSYNLTIGSMAGSAPIDLGSQTLTVGSDNTSTTYSGVISDVGTLVKKGTGTLVLTGSNTYSGGTTVNGGTLQGTTNSLQGSIINNASLVFNQPTDGTFAGTISGSGGFTKSGAGGVALLGADSLSSTGAIAITQGTLNAPFGISHGGGGITLATGTTLQAAGLIARPVTGAGTLTATGDLIIGNSQQAGQFNQGGAPGVGGTFNVGGNAVAIFSADTAILGSQTNLGAGGSLTALNGAQLGNASSVDNTKVLTATGTATINANFVNNGLVNGPTGVGQELTFTEFVRGAGSTTGNVEYQANYHVGNSPDAVSVQNILLDPTSTLIMEFDGGTPGSGYDQLDVSGLATLNEGTLDLAMLNNYALDPSKSYEIINGPTTGQFAQVSGLPSGWQVTYAANSVSLVSSVPEPSTLALLAVGAACLAAFGLRRLRRPASEPTASSQGDTPAILSFPTRSSSAHAVRRAA